MWKIDVSFLIARKVSGICLTTCLPLLFAQANEQLQVVRESHAATSQEVADAHR